MRCSRSRRSPSPITPRLGRTAPEVSRARPEHRQHRMEHDRLDPNATAPDLYKTLVALDRYVRRNLDRDLLHLVYMRASLINGCAFCIDMHSTDALAAGESAARLF